MKLEDLVAATISKHDDLSIFFGNLQDFLEFCAGLYVKRGQFFVSDELEYINMQVKRIFRRDSKDLQYPTWQLENIRDEALRLGLIEAF